MEVLVVNQTDVERLLPMDDCIRVTAKAFEALANGDAINPHRLKLRLSDALGALSSMPAYLGDVHTMGVKVISIFPGNQNTQYDAHQGAVLLFETTNGRLLAIIDATAITAIRTAAASGVATQVLARQDAEHLTLLGSGVQAHTHMTAMLHACATIKQVSVWSRTPDHARRFAQTESIQHGVDVEPVTTVRQAITGADVICTTTAAQTPILMGEWIEPGTHINAVGSGTASRRELDTLAVVRSRLFVDTRESARTEAGDFLIPKQEGAIDDDHIQGEIGELLLGHVPGRTSPDEITLFKSTGLAIEDVASAHHVYQRALEQNLGTPIDLGGDRRIVP